MNLSCLHDRRWVLLFVLSGGLMLSGCSSGGSGTSTPIAPATPATLVSLAVSPLTVPLTAGNTQQLTVTGTYSDGTTGALAASGVTFTSSNPGVATVSASGLVTVGSTASVGLSATVGAKDTASGKSSTGVTSSVVSVVATSSGSPTANSVAAATATAQNNGSCTSIKPFYWEIGNASKTLASGSQGQSDGTNSVLPAGTTIGSGTSVVLASASKWVYGMYVVQLRGGAANLTPGALGDIDFLHFTSGFTNMGDTGTACSGQSTINQCLASNATYTTQTAANIGVFDYDSGHMENHAARLTSLGAVTTLGNSVFTQLNASATKMIYTQPLLAGGLYGNATSYGALLQAVLSGSLTMNGALGTNPVCTNPKGNYSAQGGAFAAVTSCPATSSPISENWQYSIGHWVETDPATYGDGTFSSAGAFGTYPWIEAGKAYYGILVRDQTPATLTNGTLIGQQGYASAQCGRLIRHAWDTGVEQTGKLPNQN